MWLDPLKAGNFWKGLGTIAFIMLPVSIYIAFPLFAMLAGTVTSGIIEGHTEAKALNNLANLDKLLKKD